MQTRRSILPELASGRGTTRRVEGQTRLRSQDDKPEHGIGIVEDVGGRYPKRLDSRFPKPLIPRRVALRPIAARVRFAVDLDG